MTNVRWAHAALLAVVLPACAHTSSSEVENPATVQNDDGQPQHVPAESDWTAQSGESRHTHATLRPVFLAASNSDVHTTYALKQLVMVDAPSCDPWSAGVEGRCDLSELVTTSIR